MNDGKNRAKILLVEDDEAVCASLKFALELDGFDVAASQTASGALAAVDGSCAVLLIDYWLPDLNGLALLARLRASGVAAPALLITSNPSELLRARADAAGAQIVEKPLLDDTVLTAVRRLIDVDCA